MSNRRLLRAPLALVLLALGLGGCRLTERDLDPVRYYDFGVPEPAAADPCCARELGLDPVAYAPMLAGQTMWYREGTGSVQPTAFAVSRWSAAPSALLEQHVRVSLGIGQSDRRASLPYQLSLKLETMEQLFDGSGPSEARLTVSAALTNASDDRLLASRVFALSQAAPEPSPGGGARAMADLVTALNEELQQWTCRAISAATASEDSRSDPASSDSSKPGGCPGPE